MAPHNPLITSRQSQPGRSTTANAVQGSSQDISTNLVHKVLDVFVVTKVLYPSRHADQAGRGTGSATMLVINYRADAEKKQMISEQSSFDEEKALHRRIKPLMEWSWRRLVCSAKWQKGLRTWMWMKQLSPKLYLPKRYGLYCRIDLYRLRVNIPRTH